MAILLKDAKKALKEKMNGPLTQLELADLATIEKDIDELIVKSFGGVELTFPIAVDSPLKSYFDHRRDIALAELCKRYKKAGWGTDLLVDGNGGISIVLSVK